MAAYDSFVERWPCLQDWFDAPLTARLFDRRDVVRGQHAHGGASVIMPYLTLLSLVRGVRLDYEVLLARTFTSPFTTATYPSGLGIDLELFDRHMQRLVQLGYARGSVRQQLSWPLGRVLLHRGDPDLTAVTLEDLDELRGAVADFLPRLENRPGSVRPLHGTGVAGPIHHACLRGDAVTMLHTCHRVGPDIPLAGHGNSLCSGLATALPAAF